MTGGSVERSKLGPISELRNGTAGTVYSLDAYRIAGLGPLAFKEFFRAPRPEDLANLKALVDSRLRATLAQRDLLDQVTTWPLQLVTGRSGAVVGFIMLLLRPEFFSDQRLPSGKIAHLPTNAQWLFADDGTARSNNILVPSTGDLPARLVLCAKVAHVLQLLHKQGMTYGDLSWNNVVFSGRLPMRVVLIDCDSIKTASGSTIKQFHTPTWQPPECGGPHRIPQDPITDVFKLGLFIVRCLAAGTPMASVTRDPQRAANALDADGFDLLTRTLGTARAARPTAGEWYRYLVDYLAALTSPPEFLEAEPQDRIVVIGDLVTVRWRTRGVVDRLVVTTSDGRREQYDIANAQQGVVQVSVTRDGPIKLAARNRFGVGETYTQTVHTIDWPRIGHVHIPDVPTPPAVLTGDGQLADAVSTALAASHLTLSFAALPPRLFGESVGQLYSAALRSPIAGVLVSPEPLAAITRGADDALAIVSMAREAFQQQWDSVSQLGGALP